MTKRYGYLTAEVIEDDNMNKSFDEVVGGLKRDRKEHYEAKRGIIINELKALIGSGMFQITQFDEFEVKDGPKKRKVQSPRVVERIGCNAIMRVVERYVYPSVIKTSAASIKGRGMHRLFRKMRSDIRHDREGTRYYYKCDIKKFYQSIDQPKMEECVRGYIKDPKLMGMLRSFIYLMDEGLSIGLRASQCYGNILLSKLDHRMKEREGARYYYRYCDDITILAGDKKTLWRLRNAIVEEVQALGLTIKHDEAVRPITEGLDFLGYVDYGDHSRVRKRTKQKAARKLARVKSRRRRREIIGSFKGMAKWGDCINLYRTLTGKEMKSFKELGLQYVAEDGKKRFGGKQVSLRSLCNVHITIVDFEKEVHTENGPRTVVSFQYDDGEIGKYFTADKQQLWYLEEIKNLGELPFETVIQSETFDRGKVRYMFT